MNQVTDLVTQQPGMPMHVPPNHDIKHIQHLPHLSPALSPPCLLPIPKPSIAAFPFINLIVALSASPLT